MTKLFFVAVFGPILLAARVSAAASEATPSAAVSTTGGGLAILPESEPMPAFHAPAAPALAVMAKVGYHAYSGWHWRNNDARAYDGPAYEVSVLARVRERYDLRLDGVTAAGYYGGSHCAPDSPSSCVTNRFSSLYVDVGARLTYRFARRFFAYGEAGLGAHYSAYWFSVAGADPNYSNTGGGKTEAIFPSAHTLAGGGVVLRRVTIFAEGKFISADGVLPAKSGTGGFYNEAIPISMGGALVFVGAQLQM